MLQTIKGVSRAFRKGLKALGMAFPLRGAFHVTVNGAPIKPADLHEDSPLHVNAVVNGPAPLPVATPVPKGWDCIEPEPMPLPALPLPAVFKRSERIGSDGKKRIDYRAKRNPVSGERYWVKRTINGKARYVEVEYSKLLSECAALAS